MSEWAGRFHTGDCGTLLAEMPAASVALTVTSPPYDHLRTYKGNASFDYPQVGKELLRVTRDGGVACVVIQDGTHAAKKSLTTARLQVSWAESGWNLWETLIWVKGSPNNHASRFRIDHEYVFVFFKGERLRAFDKGHLSIPTVGAGRAIHGTDRRSDGRLERRNFDRLVPQVKCRGTVWALENKFRGDTLKAEHPATFPERLAADLIQCFSKAGDLILDPYSGSGTTCIEARRLGRDWCGLDIAQEYNDLAERRMQAAFQQQALDLAA